MTQVLPTPELRTFRHAWPGDFPDPDVVWTGNDYVALSTASAGVNIPAMMSPDLRNWTKLPDALPVLPSWSKPGHTWAPAVQRWGACWLLYYATRERASGRQCISVAVATSAAGPFTDASTGPIISQRELGGAIDPSPYRGADGSAYLVWKSDDNALGRPSTLWSARLNSDGTSLAGEPVALLTQDRRWQFPTLEAPSMVPLGDGRFVLFYSAGSWAHNSYAIGYAVCDGPQQAGHNVSRRGAWLGRSRLLAGPGGSSCFRDRYGQWRIALHAWAPGRVGYPQGARSLWTVPLAIPA